MDRATPSTAFANTLHCALELSKKSWLLAIQFPDREQPSLYPIEGGNAEKLMAKLTAARECWAKVSGAVPVITLCYEVGHDAFWLARFLKARRVECLRKRVKPFLDDFGVWNQGHRILMPPQLQWCRKNVLHGDVSQRKSLAPAKPSFYAASEGHNAPPRAPYHKSKNPPPTTGRSISTCSRVG